MVTALNRAGIHVDDTIFEPLAAADALLRPDERELGICLADIGSGSTDLVVYYEGVVAHTGVVPIGGDHFTHDVAVGLHTPLADAEKLKKLFGCAAVTRIPEGTRLKCRLLSTTDPRAWCRSASSAKFCRRARRSCSSILREHLRHAGVLDLCATGVVLTGGASRLNSMCEIAEVRAAPASACAASIADFQNAGGTGGRRSSPRWSACSSTAIVAADAQRARAGHQREIESDVRQENRMAGNQCRH